MIVKSKKFFSTKLPVFQDSRGTLCAADKKNLPFTPRRIYFLFDVKTLRGAHAHMKEKELFVCIRGSFTARIHDGRRFRSFVMKNPGDTLYTSNLVWHEFGRFSKNAIMLAISDTAYDGQKGYIMDFEEFKTLCKKS